MRKELLISGLLITGTIAVSNFAFSPETRRRIFKRDDGECQDCGKRFDEGWLLDCSHYDHDHSSTEYDEADNGRLQCLDDHLKYHQEIGDSNGVFLIRKRIKESQGGRTRAFLGKTQS